MVSVISSISGISLATLIFFSPFLLARKLGIQSISSLVVTFGILGTFLGVFIGLLFFDTSNIESSIPLLLAGLKTSFLTSVSGLTAHIILKAYPKFYRLGVENDVSHGNISFEEQLLTTLKMLNTDFQSLKKSFDSFTENIAQQNQEAVVELLENVVKKFNDQINDRLGKAFDTFSASVEELKTWQELNKNQIEANLQSLSQLNKTIKKLDNSVVRIEDSINSVETSIQFLNDVSTTLIDSSDQFTESTNNLKSSLIEFKNLFLDPESGIHGVFQNLKIEVSNTLKEITKVSKTLAGDFEKMKIRNDKYAANLEQQLTDQINAAGSLLGRNLLALVKKFTVDYEPLLVKMKDLMEIAHRIDPKEDE